MTAPARATLLVLGILISMQFTAAFHPASSLTHQSATATTRALFARGGSDEEYDSEYDSEEEDEPIVKKTKALASSTKSKILKSKNVSVKSAAANAMAKSKPVATSGGIGKLYKRMVPHIIRVCLNPFTFVRMSRAYFASLLDINYMKEEPAQNLRSALEQKAKQSPPPSGGPPKRKMKPGQAKTLSDLPQLSA